MRHFLRNHPCGERLCGWHYNDTKHQYETDCRIEVISKELFLGLLRAGPSMTEYVRDSPSIARRYCPGCEPNTDPESELLDVLYCTEHTPVRSGVADDDASVNLESYPSGSGEAGGEDNRRWCNLFHRGTRDVNAPISNRRTKSS